MLAELENSGLDVVLVPSRHWECARRGGMVRMSQNQNCQWYRELCSRNLSSRVRCNQALDTRIKRRNVIDLLQRLVKGRPTRSSYLDQLIELSRYVDPSLIDDPSLDEPPPF